jgi:hypothetical protein
MWVVLRTWEDSCPVYRVGSVYYVITSPYFIKSKNSFQKFTVLLVLILYSDSFVIQNDRINEDVGRQMNKK